MRELSARRRWLARGIGLALGLGIAVLALSAWRVPPGGGVLGTDAIFASGPTGELAVEPAGPFLTAAGMVPGDEAREGVLRVRSQTGTELDVRLVVHPSTDELDQVLWAEASSDDVPFFRGPLGRLRDHGQGFRLSPGEEADIRLEVWVPPGAEGYEGRAIEVRVDLVSEAVAA